MADPSRSRDRLALALGTAALLALAAFVVLRLEVTGDVTRFLPEGRIDADTAAARELLASELTRTMVLVVEAGDTAEAVRAGRALEDALRAEPRVAGALAFLDAGPPEGLEEALWRAYHPRRLAFFAQDAAAVAAEVAPEALAERVARLKRRLATPMSSLLGRVAPGDPTLVLPRLLERLAAGPAEGLRVVDGRFVTASGTGAVLFLGTVAAVTDSRVQAPLLAGVHAAFERVASASPVPLELRASGANRFAVRAEEASKADVRRVSIGTTVGIGVLLLTLFRSLRLALMVLPVIAAGYLAGTAACLAAFGSVHGLTLAFGGAMIGVSVDYAVHFHCHQTLAPDPRGPRWTLAHVWKGLLLSATTTVVGFALLFLAEIAGLRELALFAVVGLPAALLSARLFLPGLAARSEPTALVRRLAAGLESALARGRRRPVVLVAPLGVVVALALVGMPRMTWSEGFGNLRKLDADLVREDELVRAEVARYEQRRVVLASGADEEQALRANDAVAAALAEAVERGTVGGFRSVADLLPSAARQRAVADAVRAERELWPRLAAALEKDGFDVASFEPFREVLTEPAPEPLRFADLEGNALAPLVRPFRVHVGDEVGFLSFLHELRDEPALRTALAAIPGARLIDVEGELSGAYGRYRREMLALLLAGWVAVVLVVALRHRRVRPVLVACLPALLATTGTIGIVSLLGLSLDLLCLMALLVVACMGNDYGVLLAEARSPGPGRRATLLAVALAGLTTVLGLGLLATSEQPALFEIGATAGIGMALCLVCAPSVATLLLPEAAA